MCEYSMKNRNNTGSTVGASEPCELGLGLDMRDRKHKITEAWTKQKFLVLSHEDSLKVEGVGL